MPIPVRTTRITHVATAYAQGNTHRVADRIAAGLLDAALKHGGRDPRMDARVTVGRHGVWIGGEWAMRHTLDVAAVTRHMIQAAGYGEARFHPDFNSQTVNIATSIHAQPADLADAVRAATGFLPDENIAAVGYATAETPERLPLATILSRRVIDEMAKIPGSLLRPDGSCTVQTEYDGLTPVRIANVTVTCNHTSRKDALNNVRGRILTEVLKKVLPPALIDDHTLQLVNPGGPFILGGPLHEVGMSGALATYDTYGGFVPNGNRGMSGVDPTKAFSTANYLARYIARNVIEAAVNASRPVQRCIVVLHYAMGQRDPLDVSIRTDHGVNLGLRDALCAGLPPEFWHLDRAADDLQLWEPRYEHRAANGYFGVANERWETSDRHPFAALIAAHL